MDAAEVGIAFDVVDEEPELLSEQAEAPSKATAKARPVTTERWAFRIVPSLSSIGSFRASVVVWAGIAYAQSRQPFPKVRCCTSLIALRQRPSATISTSTT